MKKAISLLIVLSMSILIFGGCSSKKTEGELNLFNWTEYMPQSVIDGFQEEYNIKVNYTTFSSNEEMLAKIKSGEKGMYDLTIASDYMVDIMASTGVIQKLDKSKITNMGNLDSSYLKMEFDPENEYSVPYMISNALLCYDKEKVPEGIKSFNDIFDPKYENSLVTIDDQRMVTAVAALSLGYSINETDPAKLKEIEEKLISLKSNIKVFDSDTPKSSMISGETSIGYMWNAEVVLAMQENENIVPVYPEEGLALMIDNFVIPDGAKNKESAELFIDYCLRPEVSKLISEEYPYVNPNKAAFELLPDSFKDNPVSNPPAEAIKKGQLLKNLGDDATAYDDIWTKFKNN